MNRERSLIRIGVVASALVLAIPGVAYSQPAPPPPPPPPPPAAPAPGPAQPTPPAGPAPAQPAQPDQPGQPKKPSWAYKPAGPAKPGPPAPAQPAAPPPPAPPPVAPPPPQPALPPQPVAPPPQPVQQQEPTELPFYDAQGAKIVIPPPPPKPEPPSHKPDVGLVGVDVTQLFAPGMDIPSQATRIAPYGGFHFGDFGLHLGYVNLAGQSGITGGFDALAFGKGARLFESGSLSGSIAFPLAVDIDGYPGATARPTLIGYIAWQPAFRIAKCFGDFAIEASIGPHVGGGLSIFDVYGLRGVIIAGGHLDVGLAFWP